MTQEAPQPAAQASPSFNPRQCLVYFDGDCPLCMREVRLLQWLDRRQHITFVDIAAPDFDPETTGLDPTTDPAKPHSILRAMDGRKPATTSLAALTTPPPSE